jgi:hypothetical protein
MCFENTSGSIRKTQIKRETDKSHKQVLHETDISNGEYTRENTFSFMNNHRNEVKTIMG